jgi:hypothetical protein
MAGHHLGASFKGSAVKHSGVQFLIQKYETIIK